MLPQCPRKMQTRQTIPNLTAVRRRFTNRDWVWLSEFKGFPYEVTKCRAFLTHQTRFGFASRVCGIQPERRRNCSAWTAMSRPCPRIKSNHTKFGSRKTTIHETRLGVWLSEFKVYPYEVGHFLPRKRLEDTFRVWGVYPERRRSCWACTARSRKCRALRAAECTCGIASWKFCLCTCGRAEGFTLNSFEEFRFIIIFVYFEDFLFVIMISNHNLYTYIFSKWRPSARAVSPPESSACAPVV